jgi:hypothetical protein
MPPVEPVQPESRSEAPVTEKPVTEEAVPEQAEIAAHPAVVEAPLIAAAHPVEPGQPAAAAHAPLLTKVGTVATTGPAATKVSTATKVGIVTTVTPQTIKAVLQLPTWFSSVAPGTLAPQAVTIDQPTLQAAVVSALGTPYAPVGATPPTQVVWYDHDGEVLVHINATVVSLFSGLVLIALTLETEETGVGQLTVPLTVGTSAQPVGLVVGTEVRPRGPSLLVDRWGEAAIAAAWRALLDVARNLAERGGADSNGQPFIPVALSATPDQFLVLPQARQAMDSVPAT